MHRSATRAPGVLIESARRSISLFLRIGLSENRAHFSGRCSNMERSRFLGSRDRAIAFLRPFGSIRSVSGDLRIDAGEFGTEQYQLGGVIDPDEHDHERSRRAKCRFQTLLADVKANQKFADFKERSRENASRQ